MIQDFDRDGIEWNAYTSSNEIVFYMTGLDEKINKHKNEYLEALQSFEITKDQFENERQIKPTKIIHVSKNKKLKNLDIDFSDLKIDKKFEIGKHDVPLELNNEFKDKTSIICLSPLIEEDHAYIHFLNAMISLGLKSPLYDEIREKRGLVYYIHCFQSRLNKQGIITIDTQTSNKNFNSVIDGIDKVLKDSKKILNKDRFELIKDYYMVRREKEEILRYKNVNQWIQPKGWSVMDILDTITLKDVKRVYEKYYDFSKFYISSDKKEFKK